MSKKDVDKFLMGGSIATLLGANPDYLPGGIKNHENEFAEEDAARKQRAASQKGSPSSMADQVVTSKMRSAFNEASRARGEQEEIVVTTTKRYNRFHPEYNAIKAKTSKDRGMEL